jgi:AhpD family alkylhydroperoxidase
MSRVPDVDRSLLSSEDRDALGELPDLALFRMLAHAPEVMRPWLGLGGAFLASLELSARQRELAILAVARASECEYEWVQHEAIALLSGVTAEEISALKDGEFGAGPLGSVDGAVVRLATEAVHSVEVSAETIAAVNSGLGSRQTVELLCLVGYYLATAIVARSADIAVDAPARLAVVEASERIARQKPT